jgi:hypothetical protein
MKESRSRRVCVRICALFHIIVVAVADSRSISLREYDRLHMFLYDVYNHGQYRLTSWPRGDMHVDVILGTQNST